MMKKALAALTATALCCSLSGCCVYSLLTKEVPAPTENKQEMTTTTYAGETMTVAPTEQTEEAATTTTMGENDAVLDWGDDTTGTTRTTATTTSRVTQTTRGTTATTTEMPQETDPTEIPDDGDNFFNDVTICEAHK